MPLLQPLPCDLLPMPDRPLLTRPHPCPPPPSPPALQFDLLPGNQWKQYWFFANLQVGQCAGLACSFSVRLLCMLPAGAAWRADTAAACHKHRCAALLPQALVEQAMLAHAAAATQPTTAGSAPPPAAATSAPLEQERGPGWATDAAAASPPLLPLSLSVKGFPWPALTLDLGATAAALFFNMLLVFAFLQPTRAGERRAGASAACTACPAAWCVTCRRGAPLGGAAAGCFTEAGAEDNCTSSQPTSPCPALLQPWPPLCRRRSCCCGRACAYWACRWGGGCCGCPLHSEHAPRPSAKSVSTTGCPCVR